MNLILLGPPGAGKGTLAAMLKDEMQIPHISTGDIFRAAIKTRTPLGNEVSAILAAGDLVPDELTIRLVTERLGEADTESGYILDGFPRTIPQAEALDAITDIDYVINFAVRREVIIRRLSGRRIAKHSGRVYHLLYNPPKVAGVCDETGEPLIQREDDMEEAIINRLEVYTRQTEPLIEYYSDKDLLVTIDAEPTPKEVFALMMEALGR